MALSQTQIQTAFQNVLQRPATANELTAYSAASNSGALTNDQVYTAIITSPEAAQGTFAVTRFYQAAFGRVPDQGGLDQQVDTFNVNGGNLKAIATGFTQATEFTNRYGPDSGVTVAYLQSLYVNVLGRTGSSAEVQNWLNAVATPNSGYANRADVLFGFAQSSEFVANSNAGVVSFLTGAAQGTATYTGGLPVNGGSAAGTTFALTLGIDNITGTGGNDTIIGGVGAAGGNSTLGSADVINGAGGTDTLILTTEGSPVGGLTATPNLTSVENVRIQALSTTGSTVNLVNATGVTTITNDRSTDAVAVTNVQEAATVAANGAITGNYTVAFKNSLAAGTADSVNVSLTGATLANLGLGGTTIANEFETINLNAASGASAITGLTQSNGTTALAATQSIVATGTGSVAVTNALAATVTSINATGNSGGTSFDASATGNLTYTGGTGADTIKLGASLTTLDVVNGGTGTNTIGVTTGASLVDGLQVTNFNRLDIGGGNATAAGNPALANTYDVSKIAGINTIVVGSAINADAGANDITTINNLSKGSTVELNASIGTAVGDQLVINVLNAGAGSPNDVLAVKLSGGTSFTTGGDLVTSQIETVSLSSTSTQSNVTHTLSSLIDAQATTINVDASTAGLTITDVTTNALVRFDASTSLKDVSLTTGADAFTAVGGTAFILGQGNDTLVLTGATNTTTDATNTVADFVITGGKGGDNITLSAVTAAAAGGNAAVVNQVEVLKFSAGDSQVGLSATGANNFDTVTNFQVATTAGAVTTTGDQIDLTSFGFTGTSVASVKINAVTGVNAATGEVATTQSANFFGAGGDQRSVATVTQGANTFVYVDANKDGSFSAGTDLAIKLTGVAAVTLADFKFVA